MNYLASSHVARREIYKSHARCLDILNQSHDVPLGWDERRCHAQENLLEEVGEIAGQTFMRNPDTGWLILPHIQGQS